MDIDGEIEKKKAEQSTKKSKERVSFCTQKIKIKVNVTFFS
jgi:hypothetical protein